MRRRLPIILILFASLPGWCPARAPQAPSSLEDLSQLVRPLLVESIPPVLYEGQSNWGKQAYVPHALHWNKGRPKIEKAWKNDGRWRKYKATPRMLNSTLVFQLSDRKPIDKERQTFKVYVSFMINAVMDQQNWESGVRLYSGSVRARLRLHLWLECESTLKLDNSKSAWLPDAVFRLRVTKANLGYSDVVVEHIAGIGGTGARVLGEAVLDVFQELKPGLERRLLDRANAAIVKAADTKEVKLSLGTWLAGK